MSISSMNLDAFYEVCKRKSFTKAANELGLTQSALSQRVMNLESELEATLLIREKGQVDITELGQKVLEYCQLKEDVELELKRFGDNDLTGELRVAATSTLVRSKLVPVLSKLQRKAKNINYNVMTLELRELESSLYSGESQFILTNTVISKKSVVSTLLFSEEYVLIESNKQKTQDYYLDHDTEDETTINFLEKNKIPTSEIKRLYFDEIYSIIDAVSMGIGKAVVPRHMLSHVKGVKIIDKYKPMKLDVFLCYKNRTYYTELQKAFINLIMNQE